MSMNVDAEPSEVRNLAKELLRGTKTLLGLTMGMSKSLNVMAQSFQDDGLAEYSDAVYRIQRKLENLAENELETTVRSLVDFADNLERAKNG